MKRFATGLFIAVSVAFLIARVLESRWGDGSWIGFVRATAEAAMVGALADWFAVTALFRHPLGLPIPHTAIIPERKNQIGQGLGEFVQANFASGELLAERVTALQPARRVTEWLGKPENAALVGRSATAAVRWTLARLRDEEINAAIERLFVTRARNIDAGPMLGRALETVTGQDRHQDLVTEGLRTAVRLLDTSKGDLWANFVASAPWWIPERVDERVFDRLFVTGRNLLAEAANNTKHPLRRRLDRRIAIFAHELQHDEALINKAADWRDHLIDDPAVRAWVGSLWGDAKQTAVAQLDDSSSRLRHRIDDVVRHGARHLAEDDVLRDRIDAWVTSTVRTLADEHGQEIARLVATTVERWDADDTASRIELQVGRDLQFIRINGTVVGGLAGLAIFAVSRLL